MVISTRLYIAGAALAAVAAATTAHAQKVRRDFAGETTITMGTVLRHGAVLGKSRRSSSEWFCWVSYEFTPAQGGVRRNWRFWEPACGVSRGRLIPIQYVVANADVNRPAGGQGSFPSWLLFFAAGVTMAVGFFMRHHD